MQRRRQPLNRAVYVAARMGERVRLGLRRRPAAGQARSGYLGRKLVSRQPACSVQSSPRSRYQTLLQPIQPGGEPGTNGVRSVTSSLARSSDSVRSIKGMFRLGASFPPSAINISLCGVQSQFAVQLPYHNKSPAQQCYRQSR